jgi:thiamine pyrophosphate-dependent acetolactate synthase large subunit-like protein/nitrite reductase/ring-hydroxylating ferredoxin subunit
MTDNRTELEWHRIADVDELPEGRVKTVTAGIHSMALTHIDGEYHAMDNRCPHQGGPLGEGSIERDKDGQCMLRCPWHGWDFDPKTGLPPGGHEDAGQTMYPLEVREDGIYVGLQADAPHESTVTDVMAETMINWGVTSVFGIVGHSNLGLSDALRRQAVKGKLNYYGVRHEGAAAFACSGYAKLTGKPAACLTIAGPGATNLMTGLWDAKVDRAPLLALTGQVQVQVFGPGAFQEVDLAAAFAPVARFSQSVLNSSKHAELMTHAVVDDAVALIGKSKRPIIIVGYGARDAMGDVIELAEQLNAPVMTTFKAKGQIPDSHPLAAGVLGRSGTPIASWFMNECDLILALGSSFSNHTGITPKRTIIQVDYDRMHLGKFHAVTLPVWGEIGLTSRRLKEVLAGKIKTVDQRAELADRWKIWREEKHSRLSDDRGKGLNSVSIFDALSRLAPADAIIAVDVGNNTYSFGRYFESQGQRILMSGYLGSIGFAFSAALGAWAATQDQEAWRGRQVISISGDGGFGQYMGDFTTAVKYNMDITHVLLNNGELGKISKEQRAGEWPVWETDLHNPSFAAFANLCGGKGFKVTEAGRLESTLSEALEHDGPSLVEITTDAELV